MPAFLIKPLIYLALAAVVAFAAHKLWTGFTGRYIAQGAALQLKKDQPQIDKANANAKAADEERDHAKADTQACVDASKKQSDAVKAADDRARTAQAETKSILDAMKRDSKVKQQRIDSLQSLAAAVPQKDMACPDELAKARAIIQDTLRSRRAAAVPVAK